MNDALRELNDKAVITNKGPQEAMDGSPSTITDANGFIKIQFQCGPIKEVGVNGTSIENVIDLLVRRLEGFQAGPFKSRYNALAITKLEEACHWLEARTADRVKRGVEGFNKA